LEMLQMLLMVLLLLLSVCTHTLTHTHTHTHTHTRHTMLCRATDSSVLRFLALEALMPMHQRTHSTRV
jgi:hypothetical protein